MKLLNRIERRLGFFAIPNVTVYLLFFQVGTFFICWSRPEFMQQLVLDHNRLFAGQWWRVLTMIMIPPFTNPIFLAFFLYIFFMMGTALESHWGTFRYNLYLLIGYVATVLTSLIPNASVTNGYLMESVFLAFAWLYPNFEFLLFFLIPVKVKWLALLTWIFYAIAFLGGGWEIKAEVAAGTLNFVLFFHADLLNTLKTSRRRARQQISRMETARNAQLPLHVCAVCGVTDQTDRKMEFRYCPQCTGTPAYCINHIHNHQHR